MAKELNQELNKKFFEYYKDVFTDLQQTYQREPSYYCDAFSVVREEYSGVEDKTVTEDTKAEEFVYRPNYPYGEALSSMLSVLQRMSIAAVDCDMLESARAYDHFHDAIMLVPDDIKEPFWRIVLPDEYED